MQQRNESSWQTLSDPRAAKLVRHSVALRLLAAFMARTQPLASAAAQTGIPLSTALRWVRRWQEIGALIVARELARAGRPIKWYRAAAPALFVPYEAEAEALPVEVVRRLLASRLDQQASSLVEAARETYKKGKKPRWGTVIYLDRHGQMIVRPDFEHGRTPGLLSEEGPAYLNFHSDDLALTGKQAKMLQRELVALLKRYKAVTGGKRLFVLSVVLTPLG
jgi:hypothetical protein